MISMEVNAAGPCAERIQGQVPMSFVASHYVRFWHKADITWLSFNVRFWG